MAQSRLSKALLGLTLGLTGFGAQAYLIDFTQGVWNQADGLNSYRKEFVEEDITFYVQLDAYKLQNGVLSDRYLSVYEDYDGGDSDYCKTLSSSDSSQYGPYACTYDGIGVKRTPNNTTDDELNGSTVQDLLKISFYLFSDLDNEYQAASANIDSIVFLDLFANDDTANYSLQLNGTQGVMDVISPTVSEDGGFFTLDLDQPADSLYFWGDDFALAGLNISADNTGSVTSIPVPVSEPETMAMFGLSLIGLGLATRRRKLR
jgi:hypothetical protein